jgi:hypothetical protein
VQYVVIEKANVTLSVRLIPSSVVAGRNVTIFVDFNQTVTGAGLALEYRLGNGTWTTITAGSPFNGTFSYAWAVPANFTAGNYEIRAIYQGSGNYNVATSEVVTLVVTRP